MMKKVLLIGLLLIIALVASCELKDDNAEFEKEATAGQTLAGQAIRPTCTSLVGKSCQDTKGVVTFQNKLGKKLLLSDSCKNNEATDYSCISGTTTRSCITKCSSNEQCKNNVCVSKPSAPAPSCTPKAPTACVAGVSCPGNVAVPATGCPAGQSCSNGVCETVAQPVNETPSNTTTCTNECPVAGAYFSCVSSYLKKCGNYDSDSCLDEERPGTYCQYGCAPTGLACNSAPTQNTTNATNTTNSSVKTVVSCVDSDNGKNHIIKGNTTVTYSDGTKQTYTDNCKDVLTIREYACGFIDVFDTFEPRCANVVANSICRDGVCIATSVNQTNTTNTTNTTASCTNDCSSVNLRVCSGGSSGGYLRACGNYDADSCLEWGYYGECPYGCSNGKCTNVGNTTNSTG